MDRTGFTGAVQHGQLTELRKRWTSMVVQPVSGTGSRRTRTLHLGDLQLPGGSVTQCKVQRVPGRPVREVRGTTSTPTCADERVG